jgi:hypothetical protein
MQDTFRPGSQGLFFMYNLSIQQVSLWGTRLMACCAFLFALFVYLGSYIPLEAGAPSWLFVAADYSLAVLSLAGLVAVPAISERVAPLSEGWVRLASSMALLGFAVLAVLSFWQVDFETEQMFDNYDMPLLGYEPSPGPFLEATDVRLSIAAQDLAARMPRGWLDAGLIGFWIFSVSWLARKGDTFAPGVAELGIATGALMVLSAAGFSFRLFPLGQAGQFVGVMILMPLWFATVGLPGRKHTGLPGHDGEVAGSAGVSVVQPHVVSITVWE